MREKQPPFDFPIRLKFEDLDKIKANPVGARLLC